MIVVSDASPLIALASIGHLELLQSLYGQVMIPDAVRDEVLRDMQRPGSREVLAADWIEVRPARDTLDRYRALTIVHKGGGGGDWSCD